MMQWEKPHIHKGQVEDAQNINRRHGGGPNHTSIYDELGLRMHWPTPHCSNLFLAKSVVLKRCF